MAGPRIASLFSGTGALDLAVLEVFGGEVIWHAQYEPPDKNGREDKHQYAARILARHWPGVPNLWDITKVCWRCVLEEYGRPDILTGGFPCTDVSSAGKRAGLTPDTRSGLWAHMAYAISVLRPRLVVIENVEGLLSAPADRGLGLDAEAVEEEARAGRVLRALGAVLGDLASLGFDAEWARVAASEVGAPHPRKRVFVYAWQVAADAEDVGHERCGSARRRGHGPADGGVSTADAHDKHAGEEHQGAHGINEQRASERRGTVEFAGADRGGEAGLGGSPEQSAAFRGPASSKQADRREVVADAIGVVREHDGELPSGRDAVRGGVRQDAPRCGAAVADAKGVGRGEGRPEPAGQQGGFDAAERGLPLASDTDSIGRRADVLQLRPGQPDLDWGDYEPAIRRWERILGRPAPWPTDTLGRLTPVFTEWMMGLPDGWVTCTPGLTKNAMAKALGNGVVPQQAAAAIRLLHQRAIDDGAAAGSAA